eukprot:TRINITY_DN38061_c0_g1_i2.p1 TRINITY_DN38061_c0_g1~~TRINITY_DN38061_c0_g1_i2.p1  ORF type:complete len:615 (+),score=150.99 TRINITY_DN38061_c0_g1_i2:96-1847(+)
MSAAEAAAAGSEGGQPAATQPDLPQDSCPLAGSIEVTRGSGDTQEPATPVAEETGAAPEVPLVDVPASPTASELGRAMDADRAARNAIAKGEGEAAARQPHEWTPSWEELLFAAGNLPERVDELGLEETNVLMQYSGFAYDEMFDKIDLCRDQVVAMADGGEDTELKLEETLSKIRASPLISKMHDARARDAPAVQPQPTGDAADDAAWEDVAKNNFMFKTSGVAGNPVAGRWARALKKDAELKKQYSACGSTYAAKEAFRKNWAKAEYDEYVKTRTFRTTVTQTMLKESSYKGIGRIAWKEGGGKSGWRAAVNWCISCIQLGGKWLKYCEKSKRIKFLWEEEKWTDEFKQEWSELEEWRGRVTAAAKDGSGAADADGGAKEETTPAVANEQPGVRTAAAPKAKAATKAEAKAKAKAATGKAAGSSRKRQGSADNPAAATGSGSSGGKDAKKAKVEPDAMSLTELEKHVRSMKMTYGTATAQGSTLLAMVERDQTWRWCKENPKLVDPLKEAMRSVEEQAMGGEFPSKVFTMELKDLKKAMAGAEYETRLRALAKNIDEPLKLLVKQSSSLMEQHQVKMKYMH